MNRSAVVMTALLIAPVLYKMLIDYLQKIVNRIYEFLINKTILLKIVIGFVILAVPTLIIYYLQIVKESVGADPFTW